MVPALGGGVMTTVAARQSAFINELFKTELHHARHGVLREYHLTGMAEILDMTLMELTSVWARLEDHGVGVRHRDTSRENWFIPSKAFEDFCHGMAMMGGNDPERNYVQDMEVFINRHHYCSMQTINQIGIQGDVVSDTTSLHNVYLYTFVPADSDKALYELHTR